MPGAQPPEEVAQVIVGIIESKAPDVYSRPTYVCASSAASLINAEQMSFALGFLNRPHLPRAIAGMPA